MFFKAVVASVGNPTEQAAGIFVTQLPEVRKPKESYDRGRTQFFLDFPA
jgi:hypothetical protein